MNKGLPIALTIPEKFKNVQGKPDNVGKKTRPLYSFIRHFLLHFVDFFIFKRK
jgi:hypothetical protein